MKNLFLALLFLTVFSLSGAFKADISLNKTDGFYKCGEKAVCKILIKKDGKPLAGDTLRVILKDEGKVILKKDFKTDGKPVSIAHTLTHPGWLYFGVELLDENGNPRSGKGIRKHRLKPTIITEIGAIFDAGKIRGTADKPADFDSFWQQKRAALDKIPLKAKLTPLPSGDKNVKLYAMEIPCGISRPATGYLAVPANAKKGSTPAIVEFLSWSSVDASRKSAVNKAKQGFLSIHATWHGFPVGKPKSFYQKSIPPVIRGGRKFIDDRDKWVMGEVYLRVMRALDFIKSRPEWDHKTLVAAGGSLGGAQAAAAAALDKDVTIALVGVPCFAEFDTRKSGRIKSIPHRTAPAVLKGDTKPLEAAAYYDLVHLAQYITCEIFVCTGFTDQLCPPSNVIAFYNALNPKCRKTLSTNPRTGHFGTTKNVKGIQRLEKLVNSITVFNYTEK